MTLELIERKNTLRNGLAADNYVKQRIAETADKLSLSGILAARVEIANEALYNLIMLCYEVDTDGLCCNVDLVTYRILIPLPWGAAGWRKWGLRYHEAIVMRSIMLARQKPKTGATIPLFVYDGGSRTWHLNVQDYPSPKVAKAWLAASQITLQEWKQYLLAYRNSNATMQKQYRNAMR